MQFERETREIEPLAFGLGDGYHVHSAFFDRSLGGSNTAIRSVAGIGRGRERIQNLRNVKSNNSFKLWRRRQPTGFERAPWPEDRCA